MDNYNEFKRQVEEEVVKYFSPSLEDLKLIDEIEKINIGFQSMKKDIDCSILCKESDFFSKVEEDLFKKYPFLKKSKKIYHCNGIIIETNKTLIENGIEENGIILINYN